MGFAGRIFNKKQSLEREVKDLYLKATIGSQIAATATLNLTNDIILTSVATGAARNTNTFTIEVEAAAANPTDTVLVAFTGTSAAITCTVTPNDGTNNAATPVNLTTAELRELITTGAVSGKNITLTDASSLRALQTATGGGAQDLADAGEGDGVVATFANGGASNPSIVEGVGIASIERNDVGDYTITLEDKYYDLKYFRATILNSSAADLRFQLHSETIDSDAKIRFFILTGATKTDPANGVQFLAKMENKNAGGF